MSTHHSPRPPAPRRFSSHLRRHRLGSTQIPNYGSTDQANDRLAPHSELEELLEAQQVEDEHADADGLYPPNCCWTDDHDEPARADPYGNRHWPVYDNIHHIRREIIESIDDPYSAEQLKAPRMNISVVRPLVDQFWETQDLSLVYCLLVNRVQFARERSFATHSQTVNLTRAMLCEIIAEKLIRRYNEHNPGPKGMLKLANILVAGFGPFQGAPESIVRLDNVADYIRQQSGKRDRRSTALEIAIVSESKSLLASGACQRVIDAIYRGKLVYTPNSFIDILPDLWKHRPISLYDPRRAPALNQYRLIVPRTRNAIEIVQFIVLLILYLAVMSGRHNRLNTQYSILEAVFDLYALGWILDQIASMLEHGWGVYTQNLWSFLDVMFSGIFGFYFVCRMIGLGKPFDDEIQWEQLSLDALGCAAPLLIPRLAFNIMSENIVMLCLRDMLKDFAVLVILAFWCFIGFLLSLKWLHNGIHKSTTIGKWMIWIWFGLDGTGIDRSTEFHWLLGPSMMVMFAFLGNSLFVTILVSTLTNTFSRISTNVMQETHYRRAVLTFQGVKSDAIFAYMPPFNLLAVLFLAPVKLVVSPRWFHKINVFAVKVVNAPTLLLISWYERNTLWLPNKYTRVQAARWKHADGQTYGDTWLQRLVLYFDLTRFSVHGEMQIVFDEPPPPSSSDPAPETESQGQKPGIGATLREDMTKQFNGQEQSRKAETIGHNFETSFVGSPLPPKSRAASKPTSLFRQDFAEDDSEDEDRGGGVPPGFHKVKTRERMDSIIDYDGSHDMTEATVRLHKLEESVEEMKNLLLQAINSERVSNGSGEEQDLDNLD